MTRFETEIAGSTGDAPEGKWILVGGIEISCTHKVYEGIEQKKTICSKKLKKPNNFFNALYLSILRRNTNRKHLKDCLYSTLWHLNNTS